MFNFLNDTSFEIKKINESGRDEATLSQTLPLSSIVVCIASLSLCWITMKFLLF